MDDNTQLVLIRLLVVIATVGAIIFWCVGALRGRQSHLIFAAAMILGVCLLPLTLPAVLGYGSSSEYAIQGGIAMIVFGLVSMFLGVLFRPPRPAWRVLLLAAGLVAVAGGIAMIKFL